MKFNEHYGTYHGPAEVRLVRNLPATIDRVWAYLTDPEKRAKWFAGGSTEGKVGGKIVFFFKTKNLAPHETPPPEGMTYYDPGKEVVCTITKWDPPHELGFTFGSGGESEVTLQLSRHGMDTQLVITHRTTGEDTDYIYEFASGWHLHMAYFEALLADKAPPPFWSTKAALQDHYKKALESLKT